MRIAPKGEIQVFQRFERKKINKKLLNLHHATMISLGKIKYPTDYISDLVHLNESGQKKLIFGIRLHIINAGLKISLTKLNTHVSIFQNNLLIKQL